jgi:nucleotide-binding universal stress UspA family protein
MVEIRHIVCPIDFSDTSRHALQHAVAIAKWFGSQITAVHVIHPEFLLEPPILFAQFAGEAQSDLAARQSREEQLRAWLDPANRTGVKTGMVFDEGNPARQILRQSHSLRADLIVMGTHGLGGFERFVLGSVTEKVLRKAACPVMTVPPAAGTIAKLPYTHVLCPVDFSEASELALRFALSIAEEADARLTILHAFDWPPDDELLVEQLDTPEFRQLVEEEARGRLEALVPDEARVWCKPSTKVMYGKPYRQILEAAAAEQTDLIVMGVRGRNPLDLAVFGSTTNHVVRRAPCPVLTLRH